MVWLFLFKYTAFMCLYCHKYLISTGLFQSTIIYVFLFFHSFMEQIVSCVERKDFLYLGAIEEKKLLFGIIISFNNLMTFI